MKYIFSIIILSFLLFNSVFGNFLFSEIFPNTIDDSNLEYIELYNSGTLEKSLSGYILKDASNKEFIFGSGEIIGSGSFKKYFRSETKILLNNTSEDLFLYNNSGILIDSFSYTGTIKGEKINIIENNILVNTGSLINTGATNTGIIINYDDFELKYNFQNPSYILEKDNLKEKYICDNSKDTCKINLDLRSSFTGDFLEDDFECEIDFGFLGWKNGEEDKCNPGTIIYPKGNFDLKFKIILKEDNLKIFTGGFFLENKVEPIITIQEIIKKIEVEKIIEKEVCSSSNSSSYSYGINKDVKKINITKPNIIIQSGIKNGKCSKQDCIINLNYKTKNKQERCLWDFGNGKFKTSGTDKKCNPGYVNYGLGNHKIKLKIYQKGLENNFSESILEFSNIKEKIEKKKDIKEENKVMIEIKKIEKKDVNMFKIVEENKTNLNKKYSEEFKFDRSRFYTEEVKIKKEKIKGIIVLQGKLGKNKKIDGNILTCFDTCSVNFDGTQSKGDIKKYYWDFGNEESFIGKNPGYIKYKSFGKYKITLTILGENDEKDIQSFYVNFVKTYKKVKSKKYKKSKSSKNKIKKITIKQCNSQKQKLLKKLENDYKNKIEFCGESEKDRQIYGYILSFLILLIVTLMGFILLRREKII